MFSMGFEQSNYSTELKRTREQVQRLLNHMKELQDKIQHIQSTSSSHACNNTVEQYKRKQQNYLKIIHESNLKIKDLESKLKNCSASRYHESHSEIKTECVICLVRDREVVFFPCGHVCTCSTCSKLVQECPLCRRKIQERLRVYLSSRMLS